MPGGPATRKRRNQMNRITQATEHQTVSVGIPTRVIFCNKGRKNNRSFPWLRLASVGGMAIALTLTVSAARAQSVSESFDYSGGPIGGQHGGAGWATPWA